MTAHVVTLNAVSSSIKFALLADDGGEPRMRVTVLVQTLEVEAIRGLEVALDHAASTAFQISGAVLYLTRSLSSLN
jgi:hypothetical protein